MTATALARPLYAALCVAPLLALQQDEDSSGTETPGLTRVEATEAPELPGAGTEFDRRYWRRSLLLDDLEERERRYAELLELAAHPGDARQALEEWALDAGRGVHVRLRAAGRAVGLPLCAVGLP